MPDPLLMPTTRNGSLLRRTEGRLWLWREFATLAVFGMDLAWSVSWLILLVHPVISMGGALAVMALILLGTHWLARWMNRKGWKPLFRRLLFIGWLTSCYILALKLLLFPGVQFTLFQIAASPITTIIQAAGRLNETWCLLITLLLAWRGISIAKDLVDPFDVYGSFQVGLFMILLYGLGNVIMQWTSPIESFVQLYGFLFCTLIAMAFARIASLSEYRGGRMPAFGSRWTVGIILAALVVVGVAVLLAWILHGQVGTILARIYLIIIAALSAIFVFILSPLLLLLIEVVPKILAWIAAALEKISAPIQQFLKGLGGGSSSQPSSWIVRLVNRTESIYLGLLLLLVILIVIISITWKNRVHRLQMENETSSENHSLTHGLRDFFRQLSANRIWRAGRWLAAARIRRIYAQLMRLCEQLESPRPQAVTPLEFIPNLEKIFPNNSNEVTLLTQAYIRVRYGELPESQAEIQQVLAAWDAVAAVGKSMLRLRTRTR